MNNSKATNTLFPIFIKIEAMKVLLVGAGNVALEKLKTIKFNAPQTHICVVAKEISSQFADYASSCEYVELIKDNYSNNYLKNIDVVFSAVNDLSLSAQIFADAQQEGKLCNSADKPELCHFYLSAIVTKGDLKLAISTNGKSPTMAKRLKEVLQHALPNQLDDVVQNMHILRRRLSGNFAKKVEQLNALTRLMLEDKSAKVYTLCKRIVLGCLFALFFMISGHAILSLFPFEQWRSWLLGMSTKVDYPWVTLMFTTGFVASLVDGMLGMGFGVISTTLLLLLGVNPAIVSSRVHSTRVFSSGLVGYSHHRRGNINKRLFKALVLPGCFGAIMGAALSCLTKEQHAHWVRLVLAIYTLYLGVCILRRAFHKRKTIEKIRKAGWLATFGGMLDAFAGGGWGSLVTSSLMSKTRNPRKVIGSVCLAEFFVMLASALTFCLLLHYIPVQDAGAMIAGGLLAAPLAASLAGKLPHKYLFLIVGSLVIFSSMLTLWKSVQ
jgi:uncharacterized protein